jgi:hypothetical protein
MSPDADLYWGVSLVDEYGEGQHESINEDLDLYELLDKYYQEKYSTPEFKGLSYETGGHHDYGFPLVAIKRTNTHANGGSEEVDLETLSAPTPEETAEMNRFLDYIEFTGDRTIRLLLVASYG